MERVKCALHDMKVYRGTELESFLTEAPDECEQSASRTASEPVWTFWCREIILPLS